MVVIDFVNGDKESVETKNSIHSPWRYEKESGCFFVPSIYGDCLYPKDFIKSIKHIEVH